VRLLDATLTPEDLQPTDEPPIAAHYAIKKKMRMEQRDQLAQACTDPVAEGRCGAFPHVVHTWPGLPLHELTATSSSSVEGGRDRPADHGADGDGGAAGAENGAAEAEGDKKSVSAELKGLFTRPHRSMVAARDRVYASHRVFCQARVQQINATYEATLATERQWSVNWAKQVAMLS